MSAFFDTNILIYAQQDGEKAERSRSRFCDSCFESPPEVAVSEGRGRFGIAGFVLPLAIGHKRQSTSVDGSSTTSLAVEVRQLITPPSTDCSLSRSVPTWL